MDQRAMQDVLDRLIENSKIAVMTTVDNEGKPHSRWMTPALIRGSEHVIFSVTSPTHAKCSHIQGNPNVEWMFQTKQVGEVLNVAGKANVIDNPAVKADVIEAIGGHLQAFWKTNPDFGDLVVCETVIESYHYYKPLTGESVDVIVKGDS